MPQMHTHGRRASLAWMKRRDTWRGLCERCIRFERFPIRPMYPRNMTIIEYINHEEAELLGVVAAMLGRRFDAKKLRIVLTEE